MKNPKVETRSRDSNSGPHDCKAGALPHDHVHHNCHIWLCLHSSICKYRSVNLVTIYMTNRSQISLTMGIIRPEHSELFVLELKKKCWIDFVYTLASTNINQSAPNLVEMYVTIRSGMIYTMDLIRNEHLELSALELEKLLSLTLFTLQHRQTWPISTKLGQICMTNRSQMSLIMNPLGLEQPELFALELGKFLNST